MLKINEAVEVKVLLLDDDGAPVAGTVSYVVYDEADTSFATGNMTAVGVTGFYTMSFTPDAVGEWSVKLTCGTPARSLLKYFLVGKGIEAEIKTETALIKTETDKISANITALETHDTDIKALLATVQADLDAPNQYKADVSALALEATLGSARTEIQDGRDELSDVTTQVDWIDDRLVGTMDSLLLKLGGAVCPAGKSIWNALGDGTVSLNTIAGYVDTVESMLLHGTYGLSAIENLVDEVESLLKNGTYGLSALKTEIDANETKIDNVDSDLVTHATALGTHDTDMKADFDRHVTWIDCWSDEVANVTITGGSTDVNLPDVIIPTLPTGATIWKVIILFKCHTLKDTSTADNAINGAAAIRIKKSGGTWGVDDIVAYDIIDNSWMVDVSEATEKSGPCFIGNMNNDNLSGEVDAAATYNLRFEDIQADGANLILEGVAVGLRVYIY